MSDNAGLEERTRRTCGTVQAHFALLDSAPDFRSRQSDLEARTRSFMDRPDTAMRRTIRTIRVVIHVVYRTEVENIAVDQAVAQLEVLNKDFQAKNLDLGGVPAPFSAYTGNADLAFELADADPDGAATSGITRTKTSCSSFGVGNGVKFAARGGADAWDTARYLNIWVCTLRAGLLGYAQFPGGPAETDGVVVLNTAFGIGGTVIPPFNLGRTTTHEVGHYLNLSHIWGESKVSTCQDSDYVADTPNQFGPNTGTPAFPRLSCSNEPHGDMFMNYMDYVDDASMFMFTRDQVKRMHAALEFERPGILL